jgi:hypothetical protein
MAPSQYRLAAELVEMIHENFQGFHPGYRGVHAQILHALQMVSKHPMILSWLCAVVYMKCRLHIVLVVGRGVWQL